MGWLRRDLLQALRVFRRKPGFAALAVFTLAVGVGANTSIFTVAHALLLRPLAYPRPDRLVLLAMERLSDPGIRPMSLIRFEYISEHSRSFEAIAGLCNENFNVTGRGEPEQVPAARVSSNFFEVLKVNPFLGRAFRAGEDQPGGDTVAVISYEFWQRYFQGDRSATGQHLTLDARDYTVIGVLPRGFRFDFLGRVDIWTTRLVNFNLMTPEQIRGGVSYLYGLARLRDSAGPLQVRAEMETLSAQYRAEYARMPDADPGQTVSSGNLRDQLVSNVRRAVLVLFGAVALVLLIACANVASLLLSRALGRRREMAVRAAIGATRSELIRQLLAESVLLALAAGVVGGLLSAWGTRALATLAAERLPRAAEIHTDLPVLAFTLGLSFFAGVLFGLAPALQISHPDLNVVLRSEGRGASSGRRRNVLRNALVISQVALSTVLLIGAGLLIRNFALLRASSPGFDSSHLLTLNIALPPARYQGGARMAAFYDEVLRQVNTLPGVRAAAIASALPLNARRLSPALAEGQPVVPLAQRPIFHIQMVSPGYIAALRIPLLQGRDFDGRDQQRAPLVAIVNQATARRYWPGQDPIGKHMLLGRLTEPVEIRGVIGDVPNQSVAQETQPEVFLPFAQRPWPNMNLIVRTSGDPRLLTAAVRSRVLAVDPDQPITGVQTMEEVLQSAATQPRFTTTLLASLSAIALILAVVGIYGVVAHSVAERTQEMGIRMALGAARSDIFRLVLFRGAALAISGIALGLTGSFALKGVMAGLLFRVSPGDPATFVTSAVLFTVVALVASYLPARHATRVDPMTALREE